MKTLLPTPQCVDCLISLANRSTALPGIGACNAEKQAQAAARRIVENTRNGGLSSPQIANRIMREIRNLTGIEDPYGEFKAREMEQAQKIFSSMKNHVGEDLQSCISLAILGNSLDFFKDPEQSLAEVPQQFKQGIAFFRDDIDTLDAFLEKRPERILYLADNAGEIYFDLPLHEYIRRRSGQVFLIVKGGPSLNDLTRVELQSARLEEMFDHVTDTGTDGVGIDWENVSEEFLDLVDGADLIVSKGVANFETLYPREVPPATFYLFKVKCEPIKIHLRAPLDSYLALWKQGTDGH